jgi:hypothetical protein
MSEKEQKNEQTNVRSSMSVRYGSVLELTRVGDIFPAYSVKDGVCRCRCKAECRNAGKHPIGFLVPRGLLDATRDSLQIMQWYGRVPWANWALVAGNDWWALDVDPRHGGDASLAKLQDQHGNLPKTVLSRTGGGGLHFFFRAPSENKVRNTTNVLGHDYPGLDTRAGGRGYVIAPPSVHKSGRDYRWEPDCAPGQIEVASAPDWLIDGVIEKPRVRRMVEPPKADDITELDRRRAQGLLKWATTRVAEACEGERNNILFQMSARIGSWVGAGYLDQSEAESALEDAAEVCGLGWREAERTIVSGMARGEDDPQGLPDDAERTDGWMAKRGLVVDPRDVDADSAIQLRIGSRRSR